MLFWQHLGNFVQGALSRALPFLQVQGQLAIQQNQQRVQSQQIEVTRFTQECQLSISKMRLEEFTANLKVRAIELQNNLEEKAKDRQLTVQENEKSRALTEYLKKLDIEAQMMIHNDNLEMQKWRVEKEKELMLLRLKIEGENQIRIIEERAKDRQLTVQENEKSRALTEYLKKLDIEAQMMIHNDNLEMQKWRVEKEKELMLLRLEIEGQKQIRLVKEQLQNAIAQMQEKRRIDNSPTRTLACDLVEEWQRFDDPCALVLLYSPPVIHHEASTVVIARTPQDFPDCEYELEHDLLHFQMFYNAKGRPILLKTGEWISKYIRGTAAVSSMYRETYMIPTVIMDITAANDKAFVNIGYWEPSFKKAEYFPATSKPLAWRNFNDQVVTYFSIISQLWLGILADIHYLVHVPIERRQTPILPSLLPELLGNLDQEDQGELIKMVVSHYESVYSALAQVQPLLIADLRLDLALSLAQLPAKVGANAQLKASLRDWLRMYNVQVEDDLPALINAVESLLTIRDNAYVNKLNWVLKAIAINSQVNIATACYQRGLRRNQSGEYGAARTDLDRVISLNPHADAYFHRAFACLKLEDYNGAISDLDKAAMLQPQRAEIYEYRGDAYQGLKNYENALANYNQAVALGHPSDKRDGLQRKLNDIRRQEEAARQLRQQQEEEERQRRRQQEEEEAKCFLEEEGFLLEEEECLPDIKDFDLEDMFPDSLALDE